MKGKLSGGSKEHCAFLTVYTAFQKTGLIYHSPCSLLFNVPSLPYPCFSSSPHLIFAHASTSSMEQDLPKLKRLEETPQVSTHSFIFLEFSHP